MGLVTGLTLPERKGSPTPNWATTLQSAGKSGVPEGRGWAGARREPPAGHTAPEDKP